VLAAGAIGEYTDGCVSRASVYIAVSIRRLLTIAGDAQCKALQLKALRCMFAGHVRALSGAQSRTALLVESVAFARCPEPASRGHSRAIRWQSSKKACSNACHHKYALQFRRALLKMRLHIQMACSRTAGHKQEINAVFVLRTHSTW